MQKIIFASLLNAVTTTTAHLCKVECHKAPVAVNPLWQEYTRACSACMIPSADYGSSCARQQCLKLCQGSKQDRHTDGRLASANSIPDKRVRQQSCFWYPCSLHQIHFVGTRSQIVQHQCEL
jgi:hypothetical protein